MGKPNAFSAVYLLEDTVLFGGVKVILRQADLLSARGHEVTVVSRGPRPDWCDLQSSFLQVEGFTPDSVPAADVTIATYWSTIGSACRVSRGEVVHYCQGYEATYTHNTADHPAIENAYDTDIPAIVVSPHLATLLTEKFSRPARLVLQPLESFWSPGWRRHLVRQPHNPARVLVVGPWEGEWKGIPTGLKAAIHMRRQGFDIQIVRLSQYPATDAESRLLVADEYHHHLTPREATRLVRSCDLLLAPSWEQEGFGLPVLEAFAAGVPVVASDISSFRGFASEAATLVPYDDPAAFAAAAQQMLSSPRRWRRHRARGFSVARRFATNRAAASAENALRWVISGRWRDEVTTGRADPTRS